MMYFLIGCRNVVKNLRKNTLTLTMISFGMVALFIYSGSNSHMFRQFRESVIHDQFGHFQLYARGFNDTDSGDRGSCRIENYTRLETELLRDSDIDFIAPRLHFSGIASGDEKSCIIRGFGGDPAAEARMEYGRPSRGRFPGRGRLYSKNGGDAAGRLYSKNGSDAAGRFPGEDADADGEAVMGENALSKCGLEVGEYVTVLAGMNSGGMNAADFLITGARSGYGESDRMNGMFIVADLAGVQQLLEAPDTVDTVIVHLAEGVTAEEKEAAITAYCDRYDLEYRRWDELAVFYERSREVFSMNEHILTAIILVISIFIIINTLYMAYLSRMREIGTMRAMGTTRGQVVRIILNESLVLSLAGCTLGVVAAGVITLVVRVSGGIYHPPTVFNEEAFYTFIQPDPRTIAGCFVLFLLVSAVASLVIALRAFKFSIADCLRWN